MLIFIEKIFAIVAYVIEHAQPNAFFIAATALVATGEFVPRAPVKALVTPDVA
jgi:hypothetical protein